MFAPLREFCGVQMTQRLSFHPMDARESSRAPQTVVRGQVA